MVRLGVIGIGNVGQLHVGNLQSGKAGDCKLAAVADIDPSRLTPFQGIPVFPDARSLIRSGKVDAVIVSTPHYSHTPIAIEALKAGLHVLVEKPLAVHKADAEKMIAAHTNRKQVFALMLQMRTDPFFLRIKRLIDEGELGEIQRTQWTITDWFRTEAYYASSGWRATWEGEGGGILVNQCPHNLDMFQWICGMPVRVRAHCFFGKYHNIEVEDEVTAYVEYANGATGVFITTTGEAPGTNRLEIAGDRGKVVYENNRITFIRNEIPANVFRRTSKGLWDTPATWAIDIPAGNHGEQHIGILRNFVKAIQEGEPLIAPAEEGIRQVELANAMLYSAWTGKTSQLPLDGRAYERLLKRRIAESRSRKAPRKKVVRVENPDMSKSFR